MEYQRRLKKNQTVKLMNGQTAKVVGKLGEGGQGVVYRVVIDGTREERALKWYFITKIQNPDEYRSNLADNISNGSPSDTFVWPEQLTEWQNGSFGYTMKIIPDRYQGFPKYLLAKARFKNCSAMLDAAIEIVAAFKALISSGYSFQDVNDGSFMIDPDTGEVLICDCDNVVPYGHNSGIVGKARYKAPEIVRGESLPDKKTDRFSLALILFMLLVGNHPLEGARTNVPCLTNKYDRKLFGTEPVFIFDPVNSSNRPIAGLHRNAINLWPYYPKYIKDAFIRSFSKESLIRAEGRLLEQEWISLLMQLKSSIIKCPDCGCEMFLDKNGEARCPDCGNVAKSAGYFRFNKKRSNVDVVVPIYEGCKMYGFHVDESSEDHRKVNASVVVKPGKVGLHNSSGRSWTCNAAGGRSAVKEDGSTIVLGSGLCLDFGRGILAEVCTY